MKHITLLFFTLLTIISCQNSESIYDSSGVFEADDFIISAESMGKLLTFQVQEGDLLTKGDTVGIIDCENLNLQKDQISATIRSLNLKKGDAEPQILVLEQQLQSQNAQLAVQQKQMEVFKKEAQRIKNLVEAKAAPSKQLDDIQGKIDVLSEQIQASKSQFNITKQQIAAQKSMVNLQNRAIMSEQSPLETKISQVENQMESCMVTNPVSGTVLNSFVNQYEIVTPGKPLYKIADMTNMTLRAYISGDQLSQIKLNQSVRVFIDKGAEEYREYQGTVQWISSEAEFTPKTIQTKDERANLVYAIKINVANDGYIKSGMYGEVLLKNATDD